MPSQSERTISPVNIVVPALMLLGAGLASHAASTFIVSHFEVRPRPEDLLFQLLPYVSAGQYVADLSVFSALAIVAYYGLAKARSEVPRIMAVIATMYLLRSVMIVLTPLAPAHGEGVVFGFVPYIQNGMWPSGHTAATFLSYLLIDREKAASLKRFVGMLVVAECASLLLARGHYSIDVIGGLLLAYFVFHEWTQGRLMRPLKALVEPHAAR